jgi:hypothetical protein
MSAMGADAFLAGIALVVVEFPRLEAALKRVGSGWVAERRWQGEKIRLPWK